MSLIDRVWNWFGVQGEEDYEDYALPPGIEENDSKKSVANIVSIHSNKNMKVVISEPINFEEAQMLADHLKNRKQVILNFENTSPEISQRIIDFISGTTYSLDGHSQQLGTNIFLFTPSNVEIAKDHRSLTSKSSYKSSNPFMAE